MKADDAKRPKEEDRRLRKIAGGNW
jgi:hypothetical protein